MLALSRLLDSCIVVLLIPRYFAVVRLTLSWNVPLVTCTQVVVLSVSCQFFVFGVLNLNLRLYQIVTIILDLFESGLLNQFLLTMLFETVGVATSKSLICRCGSAKCNFTLKVFFTVKMAISRDRLILTRRLLGWHLVSLFLNILLIQILMRESLHMCLKLGCLLQNKLIWVEASRVHATVEVGTGLALAWNCLILTHQASVTPLRHV